MSASFTSRCDLHTKEALVAQKEDTACYWVRAVQAAKAGEFVEIEKSLGITGFSRHPLRPHFALEMRALTDQFTCA